VFVQSFHLLAGATTATSLKPTSILFTQEHQGLLMTALSSIISFEGIIVMHPVIHQSACNFILIYCSDLAGGTLFKSRTCCNWACTLYLHSTVPQNIRRQQSRNLVVWVYHLINLHIDLNKFVITTSLGVLECKVCEQP
jgi:hypothetical protein